MRLHFVKISSHGQGTRGVKLDNANHIFRCHAMLAAHLSGDVGGEVCIMGRWWICIMYAIVQQFYAHQPCDTPKCNTTMLLPSEMMRTKLEELAHHKMGNSHVLFKICGSSQVSLPVML